MVRQALLGAIWSLRESCDGEHFALPLSRLFCLYGAGRAKPILHFCWLLWQVLPRLCVATGNNSYVEWNSPLPAVSVGLILLSLYDLYMIYIRPLVRRLSIYLYLMPDTAAHCYNQPAPGSDNNAQFHPRDFCLYPVWNQQSVLMLTTSFK